MLWSYNLNSNFSPNHNTLLTVMGLGMQNNLAVLFILLFINVF